MNHMTTLGEVSEKVAGLSQNCFDTMVPIRELSFDSLDTIRIGSEPHQLKPIAQQAVCSRLGIPLYYLKKCPSDIQAENLNYWIKSERNEELFFRFDGDNVRAIFTPRYVPLDNHEVLDRLYTVGYTETTPVQCHLDADFMAISIPDAEKTFAVNGDKMRPGISVSNSEVGIHALSIAAFVLRLVCTNGLVVKTAIATSSYRHVSEKIFRELPDAITKAEESLQNQKEKLRLSLESHVNDPLKTLETFNRQFHLEEPEKDAVCWAWYFEMGETLFHIVNTYTRASQFTGLSAEARYRLQKIGGMIVGMVH